MNLFPIFLHPSPLWAECQMGASFSIIRVERACTVQVSLRLEFHTLQRGTRSRAIGKAGSTLQNSSARQERFKSWGASPCLQRAAPSSLHCILSSLGRFLSLPSTAAPQAAQKVDVQQQFVPWRSLLLMEARWELCQMAELSTCPLLRLSSLQFAFQTIKAFSFL